MLATSRMWPMGLEGVSPPVHEEVEIILHHLSRRFKTKPLHLLLREVRWTRQLLHVCSETIRVPCHMDRLGRSHQLNARYASRWGMNERMVGLIAGMIPELKVFSGLWGRQGGVRGKHAKRYHAGSNIVLFTPYVQKAFRSETAVNDALVDRVEQSGKLQAKRLQFARRLRFRDPEWARSIRLWN